MKELHEYTDTELAAEAARRGYELVGTDSETGMYVIHPNEATGRVESDTP